VSLPVKKLQEHLLVIAAQTLHVLWVASAKFRHVSDASRCVETAIDQVPKKHKRIFSFIAFQNAQQGV
jgi:hypothetical protein